ncbi:hypothetical protein HKD37_11G032173 [Glycine soja]
MSHKATRLASSVDNNSCNSRKAGVRAGLMASKKRKSSDSRPQDQNDNRIFQSEEAWNRYIDNILDRRILLERNVELYHSEFNEFKVELGRQNFHKRLVNLQEGSIDVAVVKEFYANFYSPIDADSLNKFLQTPVLLEEGKSLPTYSRFCRLRSDPREMEASLGPTMEAPQKRSYHSGSDMERLLVLKLAPTSRTSDLNTDRARLVYGLITRMDMNIGDLISGHMTMMAQSNSSRLGFPALITTLCRSRGVGSDALTSYENLRLAIDLAYIIRNCGMRMTKQKTKLRAANAPSSFGPIAGIPTSSTSASLTALADLSAQSSQTSNAKLQSLFGGQILIIQSF